MLYPCKGRSQEEGLVPLRAWLLSSELALSPPSSKGMMLRTGWWGTETAEVVRSGPGPSEGRSSQAEPRVWAVGFPQLR